MIELLPTLAAPIQTTRWCSLKAAPEQLAPLLPPAPLLHDESVPRDASRALSQWPGILCNQHTFLYGTLFLAIVNTFRSVPFIGIE